MSWTNPATYQPRWPPQPRYYSPQTVALNSLNTQLAGASSYQPRWPPLPRYYSPHTVALNSLNTQLAGSSRLNPYQQKTLSYPQQESNSFFIPPYHVSPPSYVQATTRKLAEIGAPPHPGIGGTLPRLSHHIYHYPRVVSRARRLNGPLRRLFLRHQEFPEAFLNGLRDLNLH